MAIQKELYETRMKQSGRKPVFTKEMKEIVIGSNHKGEHVNISKSVNKQM